MLVLGHPRMPMPCPATLLCGWASLAGTHCGKLLFPLLCPLPAYRQAIEVMIKYEGVGRDGYHSL